MNLAEALRCARKGAHMTIEEAAEEFGVDPVSVSRWERGVRRMNDDTLVLAAQIYDAPWVMEYHPMVRAYLDGPGGGAAAKVAV